MAVIAIKPKQAELMTHQKNEAPAGSRPGYLLPSLRLPAGKAGRERNPSEAKISSLSSSSLRSRYFAKGDKIPKFRNRENLANFWDTHEVSDYLDELSPVDLKFDLGRPKEETVMFRLDSGVKQYLTNLARNKGLSTSSLLRMWVMEKFNQLNRVVQ